MPPEKKQTSRGSRGVRRRKKRTEVVRQISVSPSESSSSSSSSSSTESDSSSDGEEAAPVKDTKTSDRVKVPVAKKQKLNDETEEAPRPIGHTKAEESLDTNGKAPHTAGPVVSEDVNDRAIVSERPEEAGPSQKSHVEDESDFDSLYLRAITQEFAADLDKLRKAPDFKDSSVPILIKALKQGSSLFSEEEKRTAMSQKGA